MAIVIPRYFAKEGQLTSLAEDTLFGAEFRIHEELTHYSLITTHHALVFILRGIKIIHFPEGDQIINEGSYIFIPKGSYIFSDIHPNGDDAQRVVLFLNDTFLREILSPLPHRKENGEFKSTTLPRGEITPLLESILHTLRPYLQEDLHFGNLLLKSKLLEIFYTLFENDKEHSLQHYITALLTSPKPGLRTFMEENFTKPLTVKEFAHLTCRSCRQFQRDFKSSFGITPQKWIRQKRLAYAHQQCKRTAKSVSDICFDSGFQNYSHFIQLFREQYQITPKQCMAQK